PNGCGKSNIYNAIHLLTAAAEGRLSGFISEEGGLENMMWSGERSPLDRHPRPAVAKLTSRPSGTPGTRTTFRYVNLVGRRRRSKVRFPFP
ncbi:RecF/RecN/SMC domain protein, partial [Klebsiella pneumoniae subsp. pneumoniae KPNIH22]